MPTVNVRLDPTLIEVRPSIVLSVSENLALAAAFYDAPWTPPDWLLERLAIALRGRHREAVEGLSLEEAAMLIATLYGGVVLVVNYDPPTPGGRIMPLRGLDLGGSCTPRTESDKNILETWASIYWDRRVSGCSSMPKSVAWKYPGSVRVAPAGYRSRPVKQ